VSAYWTLPFTPQKCIDEKHHLLAAGIINTITDFCVVLIPIAFETHSIRTLYVAAMCPYSLLVSNQ
jgi:hypothetical protein